MTASPPIDNKVAALLRAASVDVTNANPNTGQGIQGEWPPAGDHDLRVLGSTERTAEYNDGARKVECIEIQFEYQWIRGKNDPSYDPKVPDLNFKGERFQLVPNSQSALVDDGAKTKARINWDRFTGHLCKFLNITKDQCVDPLARYSEVKARIMSDNVLTVVAKIDYRKWESKGKSGTNKTEYITSNISG